jgi:hypothetical protein
MSNGALSYRSSRIFKRSGSLQNKDALQTAKSHTAFDICDFGSVFPVNVS